MKRFTISGEWQGTRLDRFVKASVPGTPFGVIQILLRKGLIYLNGEKAGGNVRLNAGDIVAINIAEADENGVSRSGSRQRGKRGIAVRPKTSPSEPKGIEESPRVSSTDLGVVLPARGGIGRGISILYEDDLLLVIDKPAGLVVQPGNRKEKGSLLDALEEYRRRKFEEHEKPLKETRGESPGATFTDEPPFRYTPVHRLDRETSGALIAAKTRAAARALGKSISQGLTHKTYIAVVEGVPARKTGVISIALITSKGGKSHSVPASDGKSARTKYSLIKKLAGARALLLISIATGRTHQIRAHLASIGHPIVGDRDYGASPGVPGRLFLHAWKIRFPHPESGKMLTVTAPPPKELF